MDYKTKKEKYQTKYENDKKIVINAFKKSLNDSDLISLNEIRLEIFDIHFSTFEKYDKDLKEILIENGYKHPIIKYSFKNTIRDVARLDISFID